MPIELTLHAGDAPFAFRSLLGGLIHEAEGFPPWCEVDILADSCDAQVIELMRRGRLGLTVSNGPGARASHAGRIRSVRRRRRALSLTTVSVAGVRDLARQTRTFAPADRNPCRVCDLVGLREALEGVEGLELLDAVVGLATQYRATDLELVRTLARVCGRAVSCSDDAVRVVEPDAAPQTALPAGAILTETVEWAMSMEPAAAGCLNWSDTTGEAPSAPAFAQAPAAEWLAGVAAARELLGERFGADYPPELPGNTTAALRAQRRAAERLDRSFVWHGALLDAGVRAGAVVRLPEGSAFAGPLRVVRRTLAFGEQAEGHDAVNRVELRPAAGRAGPTQEGGLRLHRAEVVHVADALRLGMIGVRLPWQRPGASVMAALPQDFAGAFAAPLPEDWVYVLLHPEATAVPVVLGSVYRGNRPAPAADGTELVQWQTPEGLRLRISRSARRIDVVVLDNGAERAALVIDPEGVRITGNLRMQGGNLLFE